jgi:hypothetical protein
MRIRTLGFLVAASLPCPVPAQFSFEGHPVQIHGFFSQGFLYSNGNNYLTAPTSQGTFELTDGGLNISTQITRKLRIGAQGYVRRVGKLGRGHVTLDWASADYRFSDWFGIRAGQVKTVMGLYNDTQDMEFLHTWALLPQSLYPLDLRGASISHQGGDVYGSVSPERLGTFSYTGYAGKAPPDLSGGDQYGLQSYGYFVGPRDGRMAGVDLKWNIPIPGLLAGVAYLSSQPHLRGANVRYGGPFRLDAERHTIVLSAQYSSGAWKIEWERSRATSVSSVGNPYGVHGPPSVEVPLDIRAWYASITYRFSKYLEVGTYHSRFYPNADRQIPALGTYQPDAARHVYDQALTARFDLKTYWDLKIEGHFMDGYAVPATSRGFYPQDNPQGLQPKTNLLVLRLGFNR